MLVLFVKSVMIILGRDEARGACLTVSDEVDCVPSLLSLIVASVLQYLYTNTVYIGFLLGEVELREL